MDFVLTIKNTHIMIDTTDFLNALRHFEYAVEFKHLPVEFKIKARDNFLNEVEKLKQQIIINPHPDLLPKGEGT